MRLFSILKRNSKLALRGSWGRAIIILLILMGASTIISALTQISVEIFTENTFTSVHPSDINDFYELADEFRLSMYEWLVMGISVLLSVLLISPLALGQMRWYYNLVHSRSMPLTELFYFFESGKSYVRAIGYEINLGIRTLLWMILFYAPPSVVFGVSIFFLSGNRELSRTASITATSGLFVAAVLYVIATIFYAALICRYALTPYLIADDPDLTVRQAIKLSVKYTKGYRFSLLWFYASYIGWFLLTIFMFPILYVMPYYQTGIAMYARYIIEKNRSLMPPVSATQEFATDTGELAAKKEPWGSGAGGEKDPEDDISSGEIDPGDKLNDVQVNGHDESKDYTRPED